MILIVGLGNPGEKYKNTRHNIGFLVVDEFREKNNFSEFRLSKKFIALISEGVFNNEKIVLVKPQTFMNESGKAVKSIIKNIGGPVLPMIIHDDIDLPLGKIKIVKNRGAAGHKGVESIIREIGTKNFIRFRIGIQPQKAKPKNAEKFVLQKFEKEEEKIVKEVIKKTTEAIGLTLKNGLEKSMSEYNK